MTITYGSLFAGIGGSNTIDLIHELNYTVGMARMVQVSLDDTDLARLLYIAYRLGLKNGGKRGARSSLGINVSATIRETLRLTEEMLQITEDGDAIIVLDEVKNE